MRKAVSSSWTQERVWAYIRACIVLQKVLAILIWGLTLPDWYIVLLRLLSNSVTVLLLYGLIAVNMSLYSLVLTL